MVRILIKQVIGRAGTGKTTYAMKVAKFHVKCGRSVYCLSLTHNAVENMRRRGFPSECIFMTMHAFFRIDYTGDVIGSYLQFDVLIIDEFSLISSDIMDKCIKSIFKQYTDDFSERQLYLIGDPLQLGTINFNESVRYDTLNKAFHILPINDIPIDNLIPIIRHWASLCINSTLVTELTARSKVLTKNHRSEDAIMKLIDDVIFNRNLLEILPKIRTPDEVIRSIKNDNYTVIASTYDILRKINERVRLEEDTLMYHEWRYIPNESVYSTVTTDSLYNGERAILLGADATSVTIDTDHGRTIISDIFLRNVNGININEKIPIVMPTYLYTFHRAQGLEFDNIAICIDHLFEFPMLYTGMTRARKNIIFFTMNSLLYRNIDEALNDTVKCYSFKNIYERSLSDYMLRESLQRILQKYIYSGTLELTAVNNIYKDISYK